MKMSLVFLALWLSTIGIGQPDDRQSSPVERPAGSGVIVHHDGYVLTAHHVIANAKRITIVTSGEFRVPAVLVSVDAEHDLALLKVETVGLSEAPLGYAGAVKLDQEVIAVGFQFGSRGRCRHRQARGTSRGCGRGVRGHGAPRDGHLVDHPSEKELLRAGERWLPVPLCGPSRSARTCASIPSSSRRLPYHFWIPFEAFQERRNQNPECWRARAWRS